VPENNKKTRKPRRNYEKIVHETALYCHAMIRVLEKYAEKTANDGVIDAAESYRDILAMLEPQETKEKT